MTNQCNGFIDHSIDPDDLDEEQESSSDPRTGTIAAHFRAILSELNLDTSEPNLAGTPDRLARMYLDLFSGLQEGTRPVLRTFPNREHYNQIVSIRDIPFYSMCSHHFLPFFGEAHVAYLPGDRIVGLSKLARVVEFYARRPQVQERLTEQIINCVADELRPRGAMVVMQGRHMCMEMRGVKKPGSVTTTSAIRGVFQDRSVREEFLQLMLKRS